MAEKQLIVAVEGTAAMGPFWQTVVSDYLEKIIRSDCLAPISFIFLGFFFFLLLLLIFGFLIGFEGFNLQYCVVDL
jgi:hypothetical protein